MVSQLNAAYLMSQGSNQQYEVLRKCHYEIEIDGIDGLLLAQDVTLPRYEYDAVEIFHFNDRIKIPSGPNPSDMRVEFMDALDPRIVDQLWDWCTDIYDPETGAMKLSSVIKRTGRVFIYGPDTSLARTWTAEGMFPRNSPSPEEAYSYRSRHEIVTIGMSFSVDRLKLNAGGSGLL